MSEKIQIENTIQRRSKDLQSSFSRPEYGKVARAIDSHASDDGYGGQVIQSMTYGYGGVQLKKDEEETSQKKAVVAEESNQNDTGLPDNLKSGIENLSGMSLDDVKVHYNSGKPAQLQAHAYAQGTDIHVASGQEKYLPHEAWHVVQQKQGRVNPTVQLKGNEYIEINDDAGLEKEADVMGAKALQAKSDDHSAFDNVSLQKQSGTYGQKDSQVNKVNTFVNPVAQKKSTGHVIQCALPSQKFYFTDDNGATSTWVTQEWADNLYEKQGTQGKLYGVYGFKAIVKTLIAQNVELESISNMLDVHNEIDLQKIINKTTAKYTYLENLVTKIQDAAILEQLLEKVSNAKELNKIVDKTSDNFDSLEGLIEKVNDAEVLAKLLDQESDAEELYKIVAVTTANYDDLEVIIPKVNDVEVLIKLLGKESDANKLKKIVDNTNTNFESLEELIEKVNDADVLAKLLDKEPDAEELNKIVSAASANYDDLETIIPKIGDNSVLEKLLAKQSDAKELNKIVDKASANFESLEGLIETIIDADVLAKLLDKESDAEALNKIVSATTANYGDLETIIPKVGDLSVLEKLLAKQSDAKELNKIVDKASANFESLEELIEMVNDVDILVKLLDKESDAEALNKIVSATTANYGDLETIIPKVGDVILLEKLLARQSDAAELNKIVDKTSDNFESLETLIEAVKNADVLAKLLDKESDAKELNKIVSAATANYGDLETIIPKINDNSILEKLLAKQSDAKELRKIVDKAVSNFDSLEVLIETVNDADVLAKLLDKESDAKELNKIVSATTANYGDLETIIPKVSDTTLLEKLLAKEPDAKELWKIVDKAASNFDSLEVLIETVSDADVLARLLVKEPDAKELNKMVSATTANYSDLETIIPKVGNSTILEKLLAKQPDAKELWKIVDKAASNFDSLEGLIDTVKDADILAKLLAKESDAKELNKIVAVTTANYDDLETMIPKVADNSILTKLLTKQSDAKELKKIIDKAASNFDSLEVLIEKLNNTDGLVNLLIKESDAKKVKDKLVEIKAPLEEDGLDEGKAWGMFATLAENDSLGALEIETLMITMRGHLKVNAAASAEEQSAITDAKLEGVNVGEKILSGVEIEDHLRHTVDNGGRAGADIEKLFPTGQNFKTMTKDALWYYCALDHANVTPGFTPIGTTGATLQDLTTGVDETAAQAGIRQKLALKELKTRYPKPEAVQRMFFENEGQEPRTADQPNVEDVRAASTNAHIQDRHVINNFGKIRNDLDLAYRITRHEPSYCPDKAGAFNDLGHGQSEMQSALDYLYNNNLWPAWREEILASGSKQDQIPCGTTSTHIFTGVKVGAAVLPRYIHNLGRGNQPMLPGEDWTANMTSLANTNTMIVNNPQPGIAVAPVPGSVIITGGGNTFDFAGITAGPAGVALTAAEAAPAGVEVRIMAIDGAKGGFGFNSAWPY